MRYYDWMSFNHFAIWFIVGIFFPHRYGLYVVLFLSILWEIAEFIASKIKSIRELLIQYWIIPEEYWNEPIENKIIDILLNLLGYTLAVKYASNDARLVVVVGAALVGSTWMAAQKK